MFNVIHASEPQNKQRKKQPMHIKRKIGKFKL